MKLNMQTQYGILLVLYLGRAGRATNQGIAENLRLSKSFLEQVSRKLRLSGVIKSVKGPGGGYEINGKPTIGDVIVALNKNTLALFKDTGYKYREFEHRALARCMEDFNFALSPVLKRKVVDVGIELVNAEMCKMDSAVGRPS